MTLPPESKSKQDQVLAAARDSLSFRRLAELLAKQHGDRKPPPKVAGPIALYRAERLKRTGELPSPDPKYKSPTQGFFKQKYHKAAKQMPRSKAVRLDVVNPDTMWRFT